MRETWRKQGNDLDAVWADFSGEVTFVITMDPQRRRTLTPEIELPEFAIMIAATVNKQRLFAASQRVLGDQPKLVRPELPNAEELTISYDHPKRAFRLQPTVAKSANRVFWGSNPDVIAAALSGPGIQGSAEFASLRKGLPQVGNQLTFLSAKLSTELKRITRALLALKQGETGVGDAKAWAGKVEQLGRFQIHGVPVDPHALFNQGIADSASAAKPPAQSCTITVNHPDARVSYGHGSHSLSKSLLAPAVLSTVASIGITVLKEPRAKARVAAALSADYASLRRIAIATLEHATRNDGALPTEIRELVAQGQLPQNGKAWDSAGTPQFTNSPGNTDFVYVGRGLHTRAEQQEQRVIAHTAPGAFGGKWVVYAFLDGHVSKLPGSSPEQLAKGKGWVYGIPAEEKARVATPDTYSFRLDAGGELVLLDAEDEREVARVHPNQAFELDATLSAIAPWEQQCWVASDSGLFRFDPHTRSWSRYAIARTRLKVPIDNLDIRDRKLVISYELQTARFDLDTRKWLIAVAPEPAQQEPLRRPGSVGFSALTLAACFAGGLLFLLLIRKLR